MTALALVTGTSASPMLPPCPIYNGRPVTWSPWAQLPRVTHIDGSCRECGHPGPLLGSTGSTHPLADDQAHEDRFLRAPGQYQPGQTHPGYPLSALYATLCAECLDLNVYDAHREYSGVEQIVCDGCDLVVALGSTPDEARRTLLDRGGWTGGTGADWDLCRDCAPHL